MEPDDDFEPSTYHQPDARRLFLQAAVFTVAGLGTFGAGMFYLVRDLSPDPLPVALEPAAQAPVAASAQPEPAAQLLDAQRAVEQLEDQLADREKQLADIRAAAEVPPDSVSGVDLATQVASLRANLDAARRVRDHLKTDLQAALAQVELQTQDATLARNEAATWKRESVRSDWQAFTATTTADLCDHGTRRAVDKCHATMNAWFTEARFERFAACVGNGGAAATLLTVRDAAQAPGLAEPIEGVSAGRAGDPYVLYCDPRLPERVASLEY